jgi:putative membrane protein
MMWGYGGNIGWMWIFGLLAIVGIALLVLLVVRLVSAGAGRGPTAGGQTPGRSRAREILDERFAKGELTADQYREQVQVLGEDRYREHK